MTEDRQLLQDYTAGSEAAFGELVRRYINLVYSAALRHVGQSHLAEDVTQTVFTALARKAKGLPPDVLLGGWLYRHTCFVAAQAARTERRRQAREQQAVAMNALEDSTDADWERLAPCFDQAMQHLNQPDRDAVLLRFFQGRDLRAVGSALGVSEEAARKRITRALEKMRTFFAERGVTLSATALAGLLAGHAVSAAPAALAAGVSGAALAAATAAGAGYTLTLLKLMTMTNLKIGMAGAVLVAAVVTPLAIQHHSQAKLREADAALAQQSAALATAQSENQRLGALAAQAGNSNASSNDLRRLRTEATAASRASGDLPKLQKENRRLQAAVDRPTVEPSPEQEKEVTAKMGYGKAAVLSCMMHARANQGLLPADFAQLTSNLPAEMKTAADPNGDGFELTYHGAFRTLTTLTNASDLVLIRQKQPTQYGNRWAKVYVCADGHCELRTQADSDFTAWESQHTIPESAGGQ